MKFKLLFVVLLFICCINTISKAQLKKLKSDFEKPANIYKPGVYWYFMDGNMTAETITKDLESMKKAGIGNLIFLEVNVGVPRGKVDFLSDEWTTLFAHAEKEARRLGIEITLGIGPGWTGSGGPWVKGNQSMQHLVSSQVIVSSKDRKIITLPVPPPKAPFFGEGGFTPEFKKEWQNYYEDVAVLAFPMIKTDEKIKDIDEKALYQRAPFSSGTVKANLAPPSGINGNPQSAIAKNQIIDLTGKMLPNGTLNWTPPTGTWKIMRFGSRNNGAITRPAPFPGIGFESNKMDTTALNAHLDFYLGKIFSKIGKIEKNQPGGLKRLHMDSWEMGAQNWTPNFRKEFTKRRGYDPLKYYPVYAGNVVGNLKESERFLWDLRQTAQELVLENHANHVKEYAKKHNLTLSIEPYDMNPTSDLELGSVADVPMAEFWSKGFGFNSTYSVIEATSIAHVMGRSLVPAEAFTAQDNEGWKQHPTSMKNQGDWAFASGINRFVYHTFQNQFLPDSLKPGATMGPYGVHWDRSQTWWPMVDSYHEYVTRCQYLLQQGRTVADILYLTPEGSPNVFEPPLSAIVGDTIGDRKSYNFDGCAPGQLMKASVKNNKIVFPSGASYEILVLPIYETMTPDLLEKIGSLINQGATVLGNPPLRSPSLTNYPQCDVMVKNLVAQIWGKGLLADQLVPRKYGKGQIISGKSIDNQKDKLYPNYEITAKILKSKGIQEDFTTDAKIRYTHRTSDDWDIYFISNTTKNPIKANVHFRSSKGSPELWNAINGTTKRITQFKVEKGVTSLPMELDAYESAFIVFDKGNNWQSNNNPTAQINQDLQTLNAPWKINFDEKWGGPKEVVFNNLLDWTKSDVEGIKYYSGLATYKQDFEFKGKNKNAIYLNLGEVKNMARVKLNGKEVGVLWTAPWQLNISDFVKTGKNELEIEVVNLWPNRLIGDEKKPYDGVVNGQWPEWLLKNQPRTSGRFTFTTTQQYNANSPLLPSGLIGPVKIVQK
ncbi:glycosyl hydrolase [Pedobacter fastidiosus]|uniref:Glycosyl hydrolase n=1 Tax=Pedobacter fastidiosus TaxID=2765361 RepID=A0ABR7KT58_9SPHI|nr:glycosyl hydrolase [Pedobacter fastidiosus]MBC6111288.1 glycosyl hydrolase [Pedobacter fastidiosus]